MRVLQLIDSLHPGGAERVAVNIANGLASHIEASFLCTTREEGLLKDSLYRQVKYVFLAKKKTIDLKAIKKINTLIKNEGINIIHAHSTSFFLAIIIKLLNNNIKIIWHDHYGNSEFLEKRSFKMLKKSSKYFSQILSVNKQLETWAKSNLKCENVNYLPNFAIENPIKGTTNLKGTVGKRIIHLANLRPQKDHFTLIDAYVQIVEKHSNWTLHCVGKDFNDEYSKQIKTKIKQLGLEKKVFIYGSKSDVSNILNQAEIAVLSSNSEGLPVALLEYGLAKLPVVATKVGECETVITNKENGLIVDKQNAELLAKAIGTYIENEEFRNKNAESYYQHIINNYSEKKQIETIIDYYKTAIK